MALSLKPSTFLTGAGLSGVCEVTDAYFCSFDFNGKAKAQPALAVVVKNESGQEQKPQHYPAGSFVAIAPSADGINPNISDDGEYLPGPFLAPVKEGVSALFADSDMSFFMTHLVNAGFPEAKFSDDARFMIGMVAEFGPAPKKYIDQNDGGKEKSRSVGVPLKVIKLPGEKGKPAAGKAASATKPAAAGAAKANGAAAPSAEEVEALATTGLIDALGKAGGSLELKVITPKVTAALINSPSNVRVKASLRAKEPEFLNGLMEAGTVVFDEGAGVVQLAA